MKKVCEEFFNCFFSLCDLMAATFTSVSSIMLAANLILGKEKANNYFNWLNFWDARHWRV